MSKTQLLTREEEHELISRAQGGDRRARDLIVERNMRLCYSIASRYRKPNSIDLDDLVQEAVIGMLHAIDKFDVSTGNKFSTYATYWIRQNVVRYLEKYYYLIRLPVHRFNELGRLEKAEERLLQRNGTMPSPEELAEESGLRLKVVRELLEMPRFVHSLDMQSDEGEYAHYDLIGDGRDMAEEVTMDMLGGTLIECVERLTKREQTVLKQRFGLEDGITRTLKEIAEANSLSREGVRHVERRGLNKLRSMAERSPVLKDVMDSLLEAAKA